MRGGRAIKDLRKILDQESVGDYTDGFHSFNELYHHRAVLFAALCKERSEDAWKSRLHSDGSMFDSYFIVGLNTPLGQFTYHYHKDYWDMFDVKEVSRAPEWDGHTSKDVERLLK